MTASAPLVDYPERHMAYPGRSALTPGGAGRVCSRSRRVSRRRSLFTSPSEVDMRQRPAVLLALALTAGLAAGCGGVGSSSGGGGGGQATAGSYAGTPTGDLNIMGFGGEDEVAQARIDAFQKSAPGVKVTHNKGDFDAQQFLTALASGNPPDLVYMSRALIGTYAAQGAIQPLTDCVKDQQIDTSQYRPAAMTSVTAKKVVYAIPEFYTVTVNLIDTT